MICMYKESHPDVQPKVSASLEQIKDVVASYFKITKDMLSSKSRIRNICDARHFYCGIAKTHTNCLLKEIGQAIGNKHHTTVIHSFDSFHRLLSDDGYRMAYENMMAEIDGRVLPYPDNYNYTPPISRIEYQKWSNEQRRERKLLEEGALEETVGSKIVHVKDNHFSYNYEARYDNTD